MSQLIEHAGVIHQIDGRHIRVQILQESACSGCHAKGACSAADMKDKFVDIESDSSDYKVGEQVTLYGQSSMGLFAVLLAFVIPFLIILLTLFILKNYIDNLVVSDRSDYDVLNEIILKLGLELTTSIEMIDGVESLYSVGSGALMIYLGDVKSMDIAEAMIKSYKENEPSIWKVVFKDNGFASDDIKANTRETLRAAGLQDGSFVTL